VNLVTVCPSLVGSPESGLNPVDRPIAFLHNLAMEPKKRSPDPVGRARRRSYFFAVFAVVSSIVLVIEFGTFAPTLVDRLFDFPDPQVTQQPSSQPATPSGSGVQLRVTQAEVLELRRAITSLDKAEGLMHLREVNDVDLESYIDGARLSISQVVGSINTTLVDDRAAKLEADKPTSASEWAVIIAGLIGAIAALIGAIAAIMEVRTARSEGRPPVGIFRVFRRHRGALVLPPHA
jgi:hypothetical protein